MPIVVSIRQLAKGQVRFRGELPVPELDIDTLDEMLQVREPLVYDLAVQMAGAQLLITGQLRLILDCQCVRCLRAFRHELLLSGPLFSLPLEGEDAVPVINECVDLTPFLREDILLAFPQHPVCGPECPGVPPGAAKGKARGRTATHGLKGASVWSELNKLKL
ncbi:MAG: YceD family protein [Verrucomicrobiae bacterium]|nr:YceD family protein [Verrucomicrobiae bacterium]MCX7721686.1 YceD family protein [Verrucomicrobiae bacterium]MDW7980956.1 YceD family protein [Verrucomicrobiales bacterium]